MIAQEFTSIFRKEHEKVRDLILNLIEAFRARDKERIKSGLKELDKVTGPHFRYEEEALYPELTEFFTEEYIEKLFGDHDMAIGFAKNLVRLSEKESLNDEDIRSAVRTLQSIMPHVSDCDGLSILVETLPEEKIKNVLDARDEAMAHNLNLIEWADQVRERPAKSVD